MVLSRTRQFVFLILSFPVVGFSSEYVIPNGETLMGQLSLAQRRSPSTYRPACGYVDDQGQWIRCDSGEDFFAKNKIVKLEFDSYANIPNDLKPFFKEDLSARALPKFANYTAFAILSNDNRQLLGLATKEETRFGDDVGATHGLKLGVKGSTQSGQSMTLSYDTNLTTKIIPGTKRVGSQGEKIFSQHFLNRNTLQAIVDNLDSGDTEIWKVGIGFVQLTPHNRMGILDGSKQQALFHGALGKINPHLAAQYNYVSDGSKDRYGAFVEVFKGLQQKFQFGKNCYLETRSLAGARISTIKDDSFIQVGGSSTFAFKMDGGWNGRVGVEASAKTHSGGVEKDRTILAEVDSPGGYTFGVGVEAQSGKIQKSTRLDLANYSTQRYDPILKIWLKKSF